jgi:sodium/potassium/calcium exchanger 6
MKKIFFSGAGVFVTTVVAGTICLSTPFRSIQRPLLRDIIFFLVAAFAAYVAMYDGKIRFGESFGFIIMYIVYLVVVIAGNFVNRRMKDRRALLQAAQTEVAAKTYGSIQTPRQATVANDDETNTNIPDESYVQADVTYAMYLRHAFLPKDDVPWAERNKFSKLFLIVKVRKKIFDDKDWFDDI